MASSQPSNKKVVRSKAPGKIILHGEHSVVFGKPAFAVAADLWTRVHLQERDDGILSVDLKIVNLKHSWDVKDLAAINLIGPGQPNKVIEFSEERATKIEHLIQNVPDTTHGRSAATAFLFCYLGISDAYRNGSRCGLEVTVESDLPSGGGLGSSSAFAVALTGALMKFHGVEVDLDAVNQWAYQVDRLFHGKPSGIDNSICTYGGGILFESGQIQEKMPLDKAPLNVILVSTRVTRNTKVLVAKVDKLVKSYPTVYAPLIESMAGIVRTVWSALKERPDDHELLELMIDTNQRLLESLGVGHESIESILRVGAKYSFKGKLTGAGGGGCVFLLLTPETRVHTDKVIRELEGLGYQTWQIKFGVKGLSFE